MTLSRQFASLHSLCETAPSPEVYAQILALVAKAWSTHQDEAHAQWLPYLQEKMTHWYALCPVGSKEDDWASPALHEDALGLQWDDIWPHLYEDQKEDEGELNGYVSMERSASYHSWMRTLRTLTIDADLFGGHDFFVFGAAANLRLQHLLVDLPNPDSQAAEDAWFAFPNFSALKSLRFSAYRFSSRHVHTMISQLGNGLELLSFTYTTVGDEIVEHLSENTCLTQLAVLDLTHSQLGDKGCAQLSRAGFLSLNELYLAENKIGDAGAIALAQSPHLLHARKLLLHHNQISDPGIKALAQSPYLANLEQLSVFGNTMSHEGIDALCSSPYFKPEVARSFEALRQR